MGRHSSDSEEDSRSHRRKKHRRRSSSSSSGCRVTSRKKYGRTKSKSRSPSPSRTRRCRRRSNSSSSYESWKKRSSRSRSAELKRACRSRRSGSRSRARRSLSRHRRSQSHSSGKSNRKRSRSRSKTRDRSRRKTREDRGRDRDRDRDKERGKGRESISDKQGNAGHIKAALEHLTPAEQVKARLQMVLQAAAETDEVLKVKEKKEEEARKKKEEQSTLAEQVKRVKDIEAIESDSFVAQFFTSSRDNKKSTESTESGQDLASTVLSTCDDEQELPNIPTTIQYQENDSLAHLSLFIDKAEAKEKWLHRLITLRQERLMGSPVP
ncbi:serine/Arginine-related protein 53-like isoform X1 [Polyodon spathula]|uniref:serine/Arginine-related protein 53-like isoform X1 n=1 Tax=Polyodon spathula TaxID=7913 RepID=UPI001B7E8D1F|nr:serine/Arginine-related protein 53-like isoform X1 [Polyodon spathula]XP_041120829.1 serine/Arginine-related protein 53-like isoform X1 [Polyodon spathula]